MFWNFQKRKSLIEVTNLNNMYIDTVSDVTEALGGKPKIYSRRANHKRMFVVDFNGDVMATQSRALTYEITSIICNAKVGDEVLVRLTSPGGAAHAYGYAASQLERIKKAGIPLTVAVDKIAASGGYMMACVADKIISAPYAIIGSVGVVAEFPNMFNFLRNLGIDYKQYTAGKYKRTVSPLGEITEEGEEKFKEDLQEVYQLFKDHVSRHRPSIDVDKIATGEHWHAINAKKYGLVDEIKTSEEYLIDNLKMAEILKVTFVGDRKTLAEKLGGKIAKSFAEGLVKALFFILSSLAINTRFMR